MRHPCQLHVGARTKSTDVSLRSGSIYSVRFESRLAKLQLGISSLREYGGTRYSSLVWSANSSLHLHLGEEGTKNTGKAHKLPSACFWLWDHLSSLGTPLTRDHNFEVLFNTSLHAPLNVPKSRIPSASTIKTARPQSSSSHPSRSKKVVATISRSISL